MRGRGGGGPGTGRGLDGNRSPAGGRAALAAALALAVFRGGAAPYAVDLVVGKGELQALPADLARTADRLRPGDLPYRRARRRDREEKIGVRGQAGTPGPPVHSGHSRDHRRSSRG